MHLFISKEDLQHRARHSKRLGCRPQISELPSGKEEQACCCFRAELPAACRVESPGHGVPAWYALGNSGAAFLESDYCCHVKVLLVCMCLFCICHLTKGFNVSNSFSVDSHDFCRQITLHPSYQYYTSFSFLV